MEFSGRDGTLSFEVTERKHGDTWFVTRFHNGQFSGEAVTCDFRVGSPAVLFATMADQWRGWEGPLEWRDVEDRVVLSATADGQGRITLNIELYRDDFSTMLRTLLKSAVTIDAGQLPGIAAGMKRLFGED